MTKVSGVQLLPAAIERTEVSDLLRLSRSDPQSVVLALSHHPNFLGELLRGGGEPLFELLSVARLSAGVVAELVNDLPALLWVKSFN